MFNYVYIIVPSIIVGVLSRISMLRSDYRQYPSYPQGVFSHLTLGIISASLGSVAIPAIAEKEFAAVTFLALAAQQFRDVRSLERQSLDNIEPTELVARGTAYIEDIAKAFEARNYMTMLSALITSIIIFIFVKLNIRIEIAVVVGFLVGLGAVIFFNRYITREKVADIAEVRAANITFDGPLLTVNGVFIMNIGLKASQEIYQERGIAVEIIPKDANAVATLANLGQRQAIQHNAAILLGIRKDVDEPDFTPIARRNPHNGNVVMAILPMELNEKRLIEAVSSTVVLESAKRKPLSTNVGKKAAD